MLQTGGSAEPIIRAGRLARKQQTARNLGATDSDLGQIGLPPAEAPAIVGRTHADRLEEGPAHPFRASEAGVARDALQRGGRVFQKATSRIEARSMDELGRGHPRLSVKGTSEVPGAHLGMPRKRLDRGILIEVTQYPLLHLLDRRLSGQLCREMRRELRLPAGTLQEQDQVPGDGQRQLATE